MRLSAKTRFLFTLLILLAGGAFLPSQADGGMICANLEDVDGINDWNRVEKTPTEESSSEPQQDEELPPEVNLPDNPQDADCGPSDISTQSGPTSPALLAAVDRFALETSLATPLVYTDPPVPASHLQRLFRPPRYQ